MLPPSSLSSSNSSLSSGNNNHGPSSDPYMIDMIKLADDRILQLQNDLDSFKQSNEILETKLTNYKNQVFKKLTEFFDSFIFLFLKSRFYNLKPQHIKCINIYFKNQIRYISKKMLFYFLK